MLALTVVESGCYVYAQVPSATLQPEPGASFGFTLNDQGRAALADRLGPSVARVDGRFVGLVGDEYAVDVSDIETLGSGRAHWSGERVRIPRQYVTGISERTLSRGRTALVAVGAAAAIAVFIVSRNLLGTGTPDPDSSTPTGGASSTRIP
ncbi:MAG: hypothetical protein JWM41_1901 [Gemmatimonadetes bacterium]|nr:hypothetical protein [Gemmatimonadota bacterium]